MFIVQAYQISQYVVPRGGIFLGKWRSSVAGSSDGKMNVQSACALNTQYIHIINTLQFGSVLEQCYYIQSMTNPGFVAAEQEAEIHEVRRNRSIHALSREH
jgi:hypothetical protein